RYPLFRIMRWSSQLCRARLLFSYLPHLWIACCGCHLARARCSRDRRRTMATMEFIGDGRSELDTIQQQWLQGDGTIEVLAVSDEVLMHGRQLGKKMVQPAGLIRRRIVYERLGSQT